MREAIDTTGPRAWPLLVLGAALVGALAVHVPTLGAYFFEDDLHWIVGGWTWPIGRLFSLAGRDHFYRPVVELYFIAQSHLSGASPLAFHLTNVLLHAFNALLVFALARRLFGRSEPAWIVAFLFTLHPRAVEMVAWISGVTGVLMTTFLLSTLLLHLRFLDTRRALWRASAVLTCALALLSHEAAVVLVVLLPLVSWVAAAKTPDERTLARRAQRALTDLLPFLPLVLAFTWISYEVNRHNYVITEGRYRVGWHALANLAHYLTSLYVGRHDGASLMLTSLIVVALAMRGRGILRCGALWILATLLPYSFFSWANTNRYLYLPSVGFALLVADLLRRLPDQRLLGRKVGVALAVALCAVLGWREAYYASRTARDVAARAEPYRDYASARRAQYPQPTHGAVLSVPAPGPTGPRVLDVEALLRVVYGDPTLGVRVVGEAQGHARSPRPSL